MANYIIIGGDGKEYGPVTESDVRQWLAEGRLNAQSLAKSESDAEFRPLEKFPEFATAFGNANSVSQTPPPLSAAGVDSREVARQRIKIPATALIAVSILNIVLALWNLIELIFITPNFSEVTSQLQQLNNPQIQEFSEKLIHLMYGPLGIVNVLLELAVSILILAGARKMKSLRSYEFSLAAATLSLVPCLTPCCGFLVGLAFGIWALAVLRKPEIKSQFH